MSMATDTGPAQPDGIEHAKDQRRPAPSGRNSDDIIPNPADEEGREPRPRDDVPAHDGGGSGAPETGQNGP